MRTELEYRRMKTRYYSMLTRCYNRNARNYHNYGGRGITVCDSWRMSFENFLRDVGFPPFKGAELDRFPDNNGNYEPGNVRWATRKEQMENTRRKKKPRIPKPAKAKSIFRKRNIKIATCGRPKIYKSPQVYESPKPKEEKPRSIYQRIGELLQCQ